MTDEGIALKFYPLSETSRIIVWLTASHGIQRTAAKNILKPGNPFYGHVDLFYHNSIDWALAKKGDLHHLASTVMLNPHLAIRNDYAKLSLAAYFVKLMMRTVEPEHETSEYHDLLRRGLDYLDSSPATRRALAHFERELASLHGINQQRIPAHLSLKDHFGGLPKQRDSLWESLPER